MQILDSGNVVLGFGPNANWAEYASDGSLLCNALRTLFGLMYSCCSCTVIFSVSRTTVKPRVGPVTGMTVQLQHEYISPNSVLTDNSGSMQILDSGNVVLGLLCV
jgi:hypothetical protein